MNRINCIVISVLVTLFCSCSSQEILVYNDGSALVKTHLFKIEDANYADSILDKNGIEKEEILTIDQLKEYYKSDQIDNLILKVNEDNSIETSFLIKNVDSLGQYLDPFFGNSATIIHSEKSFIIIGSDGNANELDDVCGCTNLLSYELELKFEKPIKNLSTKNAYVNRINSNTVLIQTSIGEMNFNGFPNELKIDF